MNTAILDIHPPILRPMYESDLDIVMGIELRAYPFPWTYGVFRDCLHAHYPAWVLMDAMTVIGYSVASLAANEAHILNICVSPERHSRGHGRVLLRAVVKQLRHQGAHRIFLEVRPSNLHAISLYHSEGFNEIGQRPRYYPAHDGREDALVMAMELLSGI
ncbi:MAG: ribosomal protein S18-alanine N-acetyltransferase [Xanthomonadaceae bacterium]|jgi:ribosomal-protein-alanine N-acetyltransferase|nr:ribosomal protein S18-alanine N-acetyltransferase [Xanthomonadaceae bacterium]